ncbi:uncharacterized protein [Diadema setosum]|uniref:uncharacterized protein n=1 Tax=Diadema setosum TaxID=31175 RepID=UPI003B3A767F
MTGPPPPDETKEMRYRACHWVWSRRTPKYSRPTVNITSSKSMESTIITCSVQSVPVVPYIKWYGPHGDIIKLVEFTDGAAATHSYDINDFGEDDQGNYSCEAFWAEGITAGKATIQLNYTYVPPVTTLQPAQSSTERLMTSSHSTDESHFSQESPSQPDESKKAKSWTPVHIFFVCVAVVSALFGTIFGCWCFLSCQNHISRGYHPACSEDHVELGESVTLETSDFQSGFIRGLDSLWSSDCKEIIVEKVPAKWWKKMCLDKTGKRWQCTLTSSVSMVEIPQLFWTDEVRIWRKSFNNRQKEELVKTLTMNCLQVSGSFTSVTVKCPVVQNTFYVQIGELKDSTPDWIRGELMMAGKKEFQDLKPQVWYHVRLGTREDSDNQRTNWRWSTKFQTESPALLPIKPTDRTASLRLENGLSNSCRLFVTVNDSKEEELHDGKYQCKRLIPGMTQVVKLKIQEEDDFRLLQEETFCTTGTIPDGGDYEGDVTTAMEEFDINPTKKRPHKQHSPSSDGCPTGLQEAINDIEDKGAMVLSHSIDETAFHIFVACLQHLYEVKYQKTAACLPVFRRKDLRTVADLLVKWDLQRLCGIFDIMRRFAADENFSSKRQLDLARVLHGSHSTECHLCDHALYLIKRRKSSQS